MTAAAAPARVGDATIHVWRFPHGRTITLVGLAHVGSADRYAEVRQFVDEQHRDGATIQFEGVTAPSADADMTDAERDLIARARAAMTGENSPAALLGLDAQVDTLKPEPHWVNADIDTLQLIRSLADPERWVSDLERLAGQMRDLPRPALSALRWMTRHPRALAWIAKRFASEEDERAAILHARNRVAARSALDADGDVVALWGYGHLEGIGEHLAAAGFTRAPEHPRSTR